MEGSLLLCDLASWCCNFTVMKTGKDQVICNIYQPLVVEELGKQLPQFIIRLAECPKMCA